MAEPADRDEFTDEEEEDNLAQEEMDDQDLGSEDEEGGGGGKKRKRLRESLSASGKRGVCYLSRVPPHMNPSHIRQMLSEYGEFGMWWWLVEMLTVHRRSGLLDASTGEINLRAIDNPLPTKSRSSQACFCQSKGILRRVCYYRYYHVKRGEVLLFCSLAVYLILPPISSRWIEFAKKSVAKRVANLLNGEQIGGKKRSSFYYDIWNIKYLRKFKWDDLVGEMAEKTHIREQKLTLEIAAAKKQRDYYLSKVEKSRVLKHIQERRKKKQKTEGTGASNALETKTARLISQKKPVGERGVKTKPNLSKDILAGVFGGSS